MAQRNRSYPRIDLEDIIPPGRQTNIAWRAMREGLREIFISDYDGEGTPGIVILPHRLQATYVCDKCMKSIVVTFFTEDAIRGHVAISRKCECWGNMKRRNISAEREVPVEMNLHANDLIGLEKYLPVDKDGDSQSQG